MSNTSLQGTIKYLYIGFSEELTSGANMVQCLRCYVLYFYRILSKITETFETLKSHSVVLGWRPTAAAAVMQILYFFDSKWNAR